MYPRLLCTYESDCMRDRRWPCVRVNFNKYVNVNVVSVCTSPCVTVRANVFPAWMMAGGNYLYSGVFEDVVS